MLHRIAIYAVAVGVSLAPGCGQPPREDARPGPDTTELATFEGDKPTLAIAPQVDSGADEEPNADQSEEALPQAPRSPFIVQPYSQWGLQETVVDSLGRIGKPAVPALVRMLRHPETDRRIQAADILARIGPQAEEAVPGLVEALEDPDPRVRKAVVRALGQIGSGASQAVGPLLHVLEESSAASESL